MTSRATILLCAGAFVVGMILSRLGFGIWAWLPVPILILVELLLTWLDRRKKKSGWDL